MKALGNLVFPASREEEILKAGLMVVVLYALGNPRLKNILAMTKNKVVVCCWIKRLSLIPVMDVDRAAVVMAVSC